MTRTPLLEYGMLNFIYRHFLPYWSLILNDHLLTDIETENTNFFYQENAHYLYFKVTDNFITCLEPRKFEFEPCASCSGNLNCSIHWAIGTAPHFSISRKYICASYRSGSSRSFPWPRGWKREVSQASPLRWWRGVCWRHSHQRFWLAGVRHWYAKWACRFLPQWAGPQPGCGCMYIHKYTGKIIDIDNKE